MDSFLLNINDYSDKELEDILSLSYPYQQEDIVLKKNELYVKLIDDDSVTNEMKSKITTFLDTASFRLSKIISNGIELSRTNVDTFGELKNTVSEVNDNFIIKQERDVKEAYAAKPTDGLNIGSMGGAPPGIINPINYRTIKRAVNIDSRFRPNYYNTSSADQQITLPYKFEKVINMRLASIELPLTYYAISESLGNNTFVVNWNISGGEFQNSVLVKIPDGNYQTYNTNTPNGSGGSEIESIMNAALLSSVAIKPTNAPYNGVTIQSDASFNLRYTVDSTSGKSVFALDVSGIDAVELATLINSDKLNYQLVFAVDTNGATTMNQPLPFFLGWELGYRMNMYNSGPGTVIVDGSSNNIILPSAIVSEGLFYIKGPQYIFIAIDDYNNNVNNYYVSAYSDSINNRNILARINLSNTGNTKGAYQTNETDGFSSQINRSRNYFGPVNIEKMRITLYDEYGRIINLNNMDWSCSIMFECMYS
jgi:hypothetical protein